MKKRTTLGLTDEERALFRAAAADVKPLPKTDKVQLETPPPPAITRPSFSAVSALDSSSAYSLGLQDRAPDDEHETSFARPGLQRNTLRDLRRGKWPVQDQLDLHGATREEARTWLVAFLTEAQQNKFRSVRIIHGKGHSSPGNEPVLKGLVKGWLTQHPAVLAYCQAQIADGGSGAVVVLLKTGGAIK